MRGLTDGGVIHVQIVADREDYPLPRVRADAYLELQTRGATYTVGVASDLLLHLQRRVAGAHCVILMGDWRTEDRHEAIAQDLVHGAFVAMRSEEHTAELQSRL